MDPFETERLLVRQFTPDDANDFFLFNSSEQVMRYIRPVKNREESDAFLEENFNLYLDGEADYHIGYALMPSYWGKGFASELVKYGAKIFFERTGHACLYAITQPENKASELVLLKNSFEQSGCFMLNEEKLNKFLLTRASCKS